MSSKILQLTVGSCDLSQAENKITAVTVIFSQLEINHVIQESTEES